jgi:hypothetical protein
MPTETIECPLCLGAGKLARAEILNRLGVKDFARVAQLSAEEAIRLLVSKHQQDEQSGWARFEAELARRTAELAQSHRDELHALFTRTKELEGAARTVEQQKVHEIEHSNRRVEDSLRELATLRERNHELEGEMAKVARVGKREELDFAEEARTWAGICVSEKLPRNGDFTLAYRDPSGAVLEPRLLPQLSEAVRQASADRSQTGNDNRVRLYLETGCASRGISSNSATIFALSHTCW